ncbi:MULTISPECIES: hypothetical protein [unclassified Nocardioides]|uniref:hypothetical protein n=1 Tax=unclassified Nocardioides TaxID=2615069 RepID=UPI001054C5C6|nr:MULTISPECIES: hypothetical protein [unclassified Nocardioides]
MAAALERIPPPDFDENFWGLVAFSLADPATIEGVLGGAGFTDVGIEPVIAAEYQGANVADTTSFMRQSDFGEVMFASAARRRPRGDGTPSRQHSQNTKHRTVSTWMGPRGW